MDWPPGSRLDLLLLDLDLNGEDLDFIRETNPYRPGGARIAMDRISS